MTDATPTDPTQATPTSATPARHTPVVIILALVVLAVGLAWVWQRQSNAERPPGVDPARVTVLDGRLAALEQAMAQQKPAAPDLAPLEARLAALEKRPAAAPADLSPLDRRLTAVEQRPAPPSVDLTPLDKRLAALEQRPVPPPPDPAKLLAPATARLDALEAQQQLLAKTAQGGETALTARAAELEKRLAEAEARATALASSSQALSRRQAAEAALQLGKPLGEIPGAPAALARFAVDSPPTEAALRLAFPAAAHAAEAVSRPELADLPVTDRMWQRAQRLVTVRQDGAVVVGAAASVTLAEARTRLDAGDLAGAVSTLDKLDPAAGHAMAEWRASAQSLLDARAALAALGRG